MKRRKATTKTKSIALQGDFDTRRERNQLKVLKRRAAIKSSIGSLVNRGKLNLDAIGSNGTALAGLNLKAVSQKKQRRLLAKIVAATARKGRSPF